MKRLALVALALAGCVENPSDHQQQKQAPATPTPAALPAPAANAAPPSANAPERAAGTAGSADAGALPLKAEVEMTGSLTRPRGKTGPVEVYVTDGECWKKSSHLRGSYRAESDRWGVEVFVPQGTKLWVCAGLTPEKPSTPLRFSVYGQAPNAPFLGKGTGEVAFGNIVIPLQPGPPVEAPQRRP